MKKKSKKYYGYVIATGSGVVDSWDECSKMIQGAKGAKYKGFPTYQEAYMFTKNPSYAHYKGTEDMSRTQVYNPKKPLKYVSLLSTDDEGDIDIVPEGFIPVWTDGACPDNQNQFKSFAGVGVYFGNNDERNVSEPLSGTKQTNQRAELTAIIRALEKEPKKNLYIYSDSQYGIKGATEWIKNWRNNGWKKKDGENVLNADLWEQINTLSKGRKVLYKWVKGHSNNAGNIQADKLAVAGAMKHNLVTDDKKVIPVIDLITKSNASNASNASNTSTTNKRTYTNYSNYANKKSKTNETSNTSNNASVSYKKIDDDDDCLFD